MNTNPKIRTVVFYKDYFKAFFSNQREKVQKKIIWTLELIQELDKVPETYLKHLENTDGLYEIRIQQGNHIFRLFCFFDKGKLIVIANGFQKKTQKTPKKEIEKALQIKENPLSETEKGKGKTIGLVFLNSSLRTRLSTQKAAQNLRLRIRTLVLRSIRSSI